MDIAKTIQELYAEKSRLEHVIAAMEELQAAHSSLVGPNGSRRGRKSMDAKERQEVSRRMKRYWASRRKQKEKVTTN